jgi:DNA-binding CsgD family transcriptional regulator/MFS family permease
MTAMRKSDNQTNGKTRAGLLDTIGTLWPGLRYLGFGVWLAWAMLAYSGTIWLSDIEVDGSNLSTMYIVSTATCAAVFLSAPFWRRHIERLLDSRSFLYSAGLLTSLGAVAIVLSGPFYLALIPLFYIGGALTGLGTGFLGLKCGQLYGSIRPRKALLYAALSQLVIGTVYFFFIGNENFQPIAGGPSLGGILGLVLLPLLVALMISLQPALPTSGNTREDESCPTENGSTEGNNDEDKAVNQFNELRGLAPVFWKFLITILVFTAATSLIRGLSVAWSTPGDILINSNTLVLLRMLMALVFAWVAIRTNKAFDFGKPYLFIMVITAVIVAISPLLKVIGSPFLDIFISTFSNIFDFLVWCLLAFIVFQKRITATIVFGFGFGIFMAGNALGWYLGIALIPDLIASGNEVISYAVLAVLIIICATLVFSQRDYDQLFSSISEAELVLDDLDFNDAEDQNLADNQRSPERPFIAACARISKHAHLSAREQDVFEQLALGRGSDNIAKRLNVTLNTARTHTHNIYAKLDVHSRQELIDLVETERENAGN